MEQLNSKECPICLDKIKEVVFPNFCKHQFCIDCLLEWSFEHSSCPLCRQFYCALVSKKGNLVLSLIKKNKVEHEIFLTLYIMFIKFLSEM